MLYNINMTRKQILRIFNILLLIIMINVIILFETNNIGDDAQLVIDEFVSRGVFVETIDNISYYRVAKKYEYEDTSNICDSYTDKLIGTTGDIYISNGNPTGGYSLGYYLKQTWSGHAAIVSRDTATLTYEIVGNRSKEENVLTERENLWFFATRNVDMVVVRPKVKNNEKLLEYLHSNEGKPYNYVVVFHGRNSFYCLDIVIRAYDYCKIDIENNGNIVQGCSIIASDKTYLIYYKQKLSDGKYNIYYLCEANDD